MSMTMMTNSPSSSSFVRTLAATGDWPSTNNTSAEQSEDMDVPVLFATNRRYRPRPRPRPSSRRNNTTNQNTRHGRRSVVGNYPIRDLVLIPDGICKVPRHDRKVWLEKAGFWFSCFEMQRDWSEEELRGRISEVFFDKLMGIPKPQYIFMKSSGTELVKPTVGGEFSAKVVHQLGQPGNKPIYIKALTMIAQMQEPNAGEAISFDEDHDSADDFELPEFSCRSRRHATPPTEAAHANVSSLSTATTSSCTGTGSFELDFNNSDDEKGAENDDNNEQVQKAEWIVPAPSNGQGKVEEVLSQHVAGQGMVSPGKVLYIRRSQPFKSLKKEIAKLKLTDESLIEIKFMDSIHSVDDKGVTRDFFTRLLLDIKDNSGIFHVLPNGSYILTHDAQKLANHDYYLAGRALAMSLVFGGPAPAFLSESLFVLCTAGYDATSPVIDEVPECKQKRILLKMLEFEDDASLQNFIINDMDAGSLFQESGITCWNITCAALGSVINKIVKYLVIGRQRSECEEFREGLQHYGVLDLMRGNVGAFKEVFTLSVARSKLDADYVVQLFVPDFSPTGSVRLSKEEQLYEYWVDFVRDCFNGDADVQLKDIMMFATGVERKPPLGWGPDAQPSLLFKQAEPGGVINSGLIEARTCGPTVILPLYSYTDYMDFKAKAAFSIGNSPSILSA